MEEDRSGNINEGMELAARFEEMVRSEDSYFFDVADIELMVEYYIDVDNFQRAFEVLKYAKEQHYNSEDLLAIEGDLLLQMGKLEEGLNVFLQLLEINPNNGDVIRSVASVYVTQNKHELAIQYYLKALNYQFDDYADMLLELAYEYQAINKYGEALEVLKEAYNFDSENETILFEIGLCYNELELDEEAISYFTKMVDNEPYNYMAWFNLGNSYYRTEDYKNSIFSFEYCKLINEEFPAAYYGLANAYIQQEEYQNAINILGETFKLDQPHAFVYCHIGECYEKLGVYDKAITYYEKSLELDADQTDAWIGIGVVKDLDNHPEEALKFVEKAVSKEPENSEFLYIYAELLDKLGKTEEAKKVFKKVIEIDPDNIEAWLDYSNILFKKDSPKAAAKLLNKALSFHSDDEDLQYRLIAYQISVGETDKARENLKKALKSNYQAHEKLFEFYPQARNITEIVDIIANYKK